MVFLPGPQYEKDDAQKIFIREGQVFDKDWALDTNEFQHFKLMDKVREDRMELEKEQGLRN